MRDCPKLLDLIPGESEWVAKRDDQRGPRTSEERELELRLGPPGDYWLSQFKESNDLRREADRDSPISVGYWFSDGNKSTSSETVSMWFSQQSNQLQQANFNPYLLSSQTGRGNVVADLHLHTPTSNQKASHENKAFTALVSTPASSSIATPQKRIAPAPVVGWPPIRSYRRNIASGNTAKSAAYGNESNATTKAKVINTEEQAEPCKKRMFKKINMDGIPIGRKLDLDAYDSYEKLAAAVDDLFRGLLAAQGDPSLSGEKNITGLLDGSGEYTLVYEDSEGDRMLVGDVPWKMFVSTVKRLRVLKSSEISAFTREGGKRGAE